MDPGLCARCVHAKLVPGARSSFLLCGRSATDPTFPRYPPLPVLRCRGFEPRAPSSQAEGYGPRPR